MMIQHQSLTDAQIRNQHPNTRYVFQYIPLLLTLYLITLFHSQSLDYDVCENELWNKEQISRKPRFSDKKDFARWIISLQVGVLTALVGCIIAIVIEEVSFYKYSYLTKGQ